MALIDETQGSYYKGTDGTFNSGDENYGNYQFVSLSDIINAFEVIYVGEGKLISKASRSEIAFHAQRALQELSFDTLKSIKSQEITVANTLQMVLPQDYVNYVKLAWIDSSGIEHVLYPARNTSNPTSIKQDANGAYQFDGDNLDVNSESTTWSRFKTSTPTENNRDDFDYDDDIVDYNVGGRYGIEPEYAQINGSFYIDENKGIIHFSSSLSGSIVILKYISDGLGTEAEMQVHKFAEEAMYRHIAYAIAGSQTNIPEYVVQRFRKEKIASTRRAKLRLSNIKLEEITQVLRNKSKQIKH
jgi:hypothetical protein